MLASPICNASGSKLVAAAGAVLFDQPEAHEAHHVGMSLGGSHACAGREIAQHHRPISFREHPKQLTRRPLRTRYLVVLST